MPGKLLIEIATEARAAIAPHDTPIASGAWDGPANKKRLRADEEPAYYRLAYAWEDPRKELDTKAAYRFIHHEVDAEGEIGNANASACIAGIAVLNGARQGTTIPDADREGVWKHLAKHLRKADIEAPQLNARALPSTVQHSFAMTMSAIERGQEPWLTGHAAVFDQLSVEMWGHREVIRRGAFKKTLREGADVRALLNHDPSMILGRSKAGTLELAEDEKGLHVSIRPPKSDIGLRVTEAIERGDIDQMSFGFWPVKDRWLDAEDHEFEGEFELREYLEVSLFDVSPVTYPAFPQTDIDIALRSLDAAMSRASEGRMSGADYALMSGLVQRLHSFEPEEPPQARHSSQSTGEPDEKQEPARRGARGQIALLRAQLDLLRLRTKE